MQLFTAHKAFVVRLLVVGAARRAFDGLNRLLARTPAGQAVAYGRRILRAADACQLDAAFISLVSDAA